MERSLRNQFSTFIPEIVLAVLGLAAIPIMIYEFQFAFYYVVDPSLKITVFDLTLFFIGFSIVFGTGLAMLFVSTYGLFRNMIRWPNATGLAISVIYLTSSLTFVMLYIAFTMLVPAAI